MISRNDLKVVEILLESGARTATKYISARQIVRATRRLYRADGRQIRKGRRTEILLTIGEPNYIERGFVNACVRDGVSFMRAVQLRFPPKKRATKRK